LHLLTEKQTAELLNCTASALRRMRREKRGVAYVRIGRLIRYNPQDVEQYVRQNTQRNVAHQ
jgi:excisionase family DNA binding protein